MDSIVDNVSNNLVKTNLSPVDELKSVGSSEKLPDLGVFGLVLQETSVSAKQSFKINNADIDGNTVPLLDNFTQLTADDNRLGLPEEVVIDKQLDLKGSLLVAPSINQENSPIAVAKVPNNTAVELQGTNSLASSLVNNEVQSKASDNSYSSNKNFNLLNIDAHKISHLDTNVPKDLAQKHSHIGDSLLTRNVNVGNQMSSSLTKEEAYSDIKNIGTGEIKNNISLAKASLPANVINNDLKTMPVNSALVNNDILNREEITKDFTLNENGNAVTKGNVLSNQLRQLLQIDSRVNDHNTNVTSLHATKTSKDLPSSALDKAIFQLPDNAHISTEQLDLLSNKHKLNSAPIGQYNLTATANASLHSQVTPQGAIHVESSGEGMQNITNPAINTFSSLNLQTVSQLAITESFGRPDWSQGLGKQVVMMVNQQLGSAEIRLNPGHLGPVEILIDMSDEQVSVSLSSRHSAVREAMELALPKLREMLDEQGYNLSDADVSEHSLAQQREDKSQNNETSLAANAGDQMVSLETNENILQSVSSAESMVDYYI